MSDSVATLFVSPSQKIWRVEEVPLLTAGVLHEVPEALPSAPVQTRELRRLNTEYDQGQPLTAEELESFASACRDAGLSELDAPRSYREWGGHLEVFNVEAKTRGWWAALMPLYDPHHVARLCRLVAEGEHQDALACARASGEVVARVNGTMRPAPSNVNVCHLVLTLIELKKFCALLCIGVEVQDPVSTLKQAPQAEVTQAAPAVGGPVSVFKAQESALLAAINEADYKPKHLQMGRPGHPGVKAEIRAKLKDHRLFVGKKKFDKAWERLRASGDIGDSSSPALG